MSDGVRNILSDLAAYFRAVFQEGTAWIFTLFDLLGIVLLLFPGLAEIVADRQLIRGVGAGVLLVSFITGNLIAYIRQRRQIRKLRRNLEQAAFTDEASPLRSAREQKTQHWRDAIEGFDFTRGQATATVWYSELRPHLRPEVRERIEAPRTFIVPLETRGDSAVRSILLDEISRIEREWDLI